MSDRVLPTVPALSKVGKPREEGDGEIAKRPLETRTPRAKNMIGEVGRVGGGAAHRACWWSLLRVWEWCMLTTNSHAVVIPRREV